MQIPPKDPSEGDSGSLPSFFENVYRPINLSGSVATYISQYRTAIRWLQVALGRTPLIGDLTSTSREMLRAKLLSANIGKARTAQLLKRFGTLRKYAAGLGYVPGDDEIQVNPDRAPSQLWVERSASEQTYAPYVTLPTAAEGTLRHFYESVYRPQRLIRVSSQSFFGYANTLVKLVTHFGRDITLAEQCDALAAAHFRWLLETRGLSAVSVNGHRARWFALWRLAHERGLVPCAPKVPKLPEDLDEPDAWSEDEASRILCSTSALRTWPDVCGIPADRFFLALLRVAWWTALRRSSLLKITRNAVDLQAGMLNVPGRGMKNRRGRRYKLGQDAIASIRDIWLPERELLFPWRGAIHGLYEHFDEILRVANIAPSTRRALTKLHKWRRTVGTAAAVRAGIEAACALLHHSSSQVTMRYIDPTKLPGNDATQILPTLSINGISTRSNKP